MRLSSKIVAALGSMMALTSVVLAQSGKTSTVLPPIIQDFFDTMGKGGSGVASFITTRAQFAIYLVLGGIIIFAVGFSIKAGIKYIQSEGDPGKIEEAQKAIKAIMFGVASVFVGIVGIVLVYVVFGGNIASPGLPQVCLSAGESVGCKAYYNDGINDPAVQWCEGYYVSATQKSLDATNGKDTTTVTLISQQAVQAGYKQPDSANALSQGTAGAVGEKYSKNDLNAALLCINPSKGGYLPISVV